MQNVTRGPFTIASVLLDEASSLRHCSPIKSDLKRPTGSTSLLTTMALNGLGAAHCIVRKWTSEHTPSEWGARNERVLLNQLIQPTVWKDLGEPYDAIGGRIGNTRLHSLRSQDRGNEEAYRHTVDRLLERVFASAFLFFLNEWMKLENRNHPDFPGALEALAAFDVRNEVAAEGTSSTIRNDVGIIIPRLSPPLFRNLLSGDSELVCMSNVNAKSTGHAEYPYQQITATSTDATIKNVDEAMDFGLDWSESEGGMTIQLIAESLREEFQLAARNLTWPLCAASHFAQVSSFVS